MDTPIVALLGIVVTPWKLVGYLGVLLFAGRWVVQVAATQQQGRPVIPGLFWAMSIAGSALLLAYFIWGKNDSVGVLSNLFPMGVAIYNAMMHRKVKSEQCLKASRLSSQRTAVAASRGRAEISVQS